MLNGKQTEGIFRISADVDEVCSLKNRLDRWDVPEYKNTMGKFGLQVCLSIFVLTLTIIKKKKLNH